MLPNYKVGIANSKSQAIASNIFSEARQFEHALDKVKFGNYVILDMLTIQHF